MQTYTATEFKARALEIINRVSETGEVITVTKRGKPIVTVQQARSQKPRLVLGGLKHMGKILGDIVSPIADEPDELFELPTYRVKKSRK